MKIIHQHTPILMKGEHLAQHRESTSKTRTIHNDLKKSNTSVSQTLQSLQLLLSKFLCVACGNEYYIGEG